MTKKMPPTKMLDQLETGPWPSFVTGLKRLAQDEDQQYSGMMKDLVGQLEQSYQTKIGYWKGGTVGVYGYGGGVIPRFSLIADKYPESSEFHTLRIQPPAGMHYDTKTLRKLCDIWAETGSGLITLHGQSGDIMFQGATTDQVQEAFDRLNEFGFDMGGAGAAVRTSMSCVGHARCEQSCFDEVRAHRNVVNNFLDEMHRPALPYKFKFKFSGCPNDCVNAIQRADMAVIGTWRDDIKVDQDEVKTYITGAGRQYFIDHVLAMCPTRAISLKDDGTIDIDNRNCVRCMHCINVMNKALSPGDDKGVSILLGGKRTLKIGDLMGTVVIPFMKLETDEDFERLIEIGESIIDFWAENALDHERVGETIERIGLVNFLEGVGIEIDPAMIASPRTNSYVDTSDWDEEADKWRGRDGAKAQDAAE